MNLTVKYQLADADLMHFYKHSMRYYAARKATGTIIAFLTVFMISAFAATLQEKEYNREAPHQWRFSAF